MQEFTFEGSWQLGEQEGLLSLCLGWNGVVAWHELRLLQMPLLALS